MKLRILAALAAPSLALGLAACTAERDPEGGVDVEPADVQMDWDTTQIRTPDVDLVPRDTQNSATSRDTLPR
jgi:hypothetical protein